MLREVHRDFLGLAVVEQAEVESGEIRDQLSIAVEHGDGRLDAGGADLNKQIVKQIRIGFRDRWGRLLGN